MAAELATELQRLSAGVKTPGPADKVFKDECTYSFDTPESTDGLYISMSSFLGFGRKHVEKYFNRTQHALFLKYQRIKHEIPKAESEGEDVKKPTRLAIGMEGGFDADSKMYNIEEKFCLVLMPGFRELPLSAAEIPDAIRASASGIIAADSAAKQAELASLSGTWDGEVRVVSKYAENLIQLNNGVKIPPSGWKCEKCDLRDNLWLNLTDGSILCGRKFYDGTGGNNHAVDHFKEVGYPLAVKLGTITPEAADVYSYEEDDMVLDPNLPTHLAHFGIDIMKMKKTDKTMTELEVDLNQRSWEWRALTESGRELKPVYGGGYTGIHNLGNSCYMNSVMQVLFTLRPFIDKYYSPAETIFDENINSDPTSNFNVQMAKFAKGLLSGDYSKPLEADKEGTQNGIKPLMFKTLVGQGHPEFSTKRQQDAQEFLLHCFNLIERNSRGSVNPVDSVRFQIEDRIECTQSHRVKYTERDELCLALGVPLEAAINKADVARYNAEKEQMEAQGIHVDASKMVRPRIPLSACLEAFAAPSAVEDFYSSAIGARTTAKKTTRIKSFPEYLFIHMQRFTIGNDWVERKLDVSLDIPEELDISALRGSGKQAGEEELPEQAAPSAAGSAAPVPPAINEEVVAQMMDMGFPLDGCKRAVYFTHNSGLETALNWAMEHVGDADFSSPFEIPQQAVQGGSKQAVGQDEFMVDEESSMMIMGLGFTREQAVRALKATSNNVERAADWIFSHADELNEPEQNSDSTAAPASTAAGQRRYSDGPGRYRLTAFISHMGTSTKVGHYVCHVRKDDGRWVIFNDEKVSLSENPPTELAYLYLYRRVQ